MLKKINEDLRAAMMDKNADLVSSLRMIKSKIIEKEKSGLVEMTDLIITEVIMAYKKSLVKGIAEYGHKGMEIVLTMRKDIEACNKYLPAEISDSELMEMVRAAIIKNKTNKAGIGKLIGILMKTEAGQTGLIDGGKVKKMAEKIIKE